MHTRHSQTIQAQASCWCTVSRNTTHPICCCRSRARRVALAGPLAASSGRKEGPSDRGVSATPRAASLSVTSLALDGRCCDRCRLGSDCLPAWVRLGLRTSSAARRPRVAGCSGAAAAAVRVGRTPLASGASVARRGLPPVCWEVAGRPADPGSSLTALLLSRFAGGASGCGAARFWQFSA